MANKVLLELRDYLEKSNLLPAIVNIQKPAQPASSAHTLTQQEAVSRIQKAWRRAQFQRAFSTNAFNTYLSMLEDTLDIGLSNEMFGATIAAHINLNTPAFIPRNPKTNAGSIYYRTDAFSSLNDIQSVLKLFDPSYDTHQYNYVPISFSNTLPIENILQSYAATYVNKIKLLRDPSDPSNPFGFIRIDKKDQRLDNWYRILRVFRFEGNFTLKMAEFGIKASRWKVASALFQANQTPTAAANPTLYHMESRLPDNITELKKRYSPLLARIEADKRIPTHLLASCLRGLLIHLPEGKPIPKTTLQRIAILLNSATQLHYNDYDRFALIFYCFVHELGLLIANNRVKPSFNAFINNTHAHDTATFGIDKPTDKSNYQFVAIPANSGTNAMWIALTLAQEGLNPNDIAMHKIGDIYYEFTTIDNLTKRKINNPKRDVYLVTTGPTVLIFGSIFTWSGICVGTDVNQLIRSCIQRSNGAPLKPTTIVIDSTSGMHRNLKIDDDLKPYITSGTISLIVHESHQKFGLGHSDQVQYGTVFGICSKTEYPPSIIAQYEANAAVDFENNTDMRVGAYISSYAGPALEKIKEAHFHNGKCLRDFFIALGLGKDMFIPDTLDTVDPDRGLFVYGPINSTIGKRVREHLEYRGSFGHYNTTWSDCGPYFRIAPSASDTTDILIEGSELYCAAKLSHAERITGLHTLVSSFIANPQEPSASDQVMLAGLLQALAHRQYKPKDPTSGFLWQYAIKLMREKCTLLNGRKCYHELLDYRQQGFLNTQTSPTFIDNVLYKFSKTTFPLEQADRLYQSIRSYTLTQTHFGKNKPYLLAQEAITRLYSNRVAAINPTFQRKMLANEAISQAIIQLDKHNLLSQQTLKPLLSKKSCTRFSMAILALADMNLLTEPRIQYSTNNPGKTALQVLIEANSLRLYQAVGLLKHHRLGQAELMILLKSTPTEKARLHDALSALTAITISPAMFTTLATQCSFATALHHAFKAEFSNLAFLLLPPADVTRYLNTLNPARLLALYTLLSDNKDKIDACIQPSPNRPNIDVCLADCEKAFIRAFRVAYKKECRLSFLGNIGRSDFGKKVYSGQDLSIAGIKDYIKDNPNKASAKAFARLKTMQPR